MFWKDDSLTILSQSLDRPRRGIRVGGNDAVGRVQRIGLTVAPKGVTSVGIEAFSNELNK